MNKIKETIYTSPITGECVFEWECDGKTVTVPQHKCDPIEIINKRKGEILKGFRKSNNLTQEAVAQKFNVSQEFISQYENGKTYSRDIWFNLLNIIKHPLEISEWVLTGEWREPIDEESLYKNN